MILTETNQSIPNFHGEFFCFHKHIELTPQPFWWSSEVVRPTKNLFESYQMLRTPEAKIPDFFHAAGFLLLKKRPMNIKISWSLGKFSPHLWTEGPCPTNQQTFSRGKKNVSWKSPQKQGHEKAPHRNLWQFFFKSCNFNSLRGGFNPLKKYEANWIVCPGSGENEKSLKQPSPLFQHSSSFFLLLVSLGSMLLVASGTSHQSPVTTCCFFGWKNQRHLVTS